MRKLLLIFSALMIALGLNAQTFEWGTASWNIENDKVFNDIDELNADGIVLTYTNPNEYGLTFLHIIGIDYDLYIDDATEAIAATATSQSSTAVTFNYPFVEGHKYKIVTKQSVLTNVNLATYSADTIARNTDSYSISFTLQGPELVKTINVEASQALTIIDQNTELTFSVIDTTEVLNALGAKSIAELTIYGLNKNGSYNKYFGEEWYDGWRDADGEYTIYSGGYDRIAGHNAYPAVYSIKISNKADSIYYYFYDYWKEYSEDDSGSIGGSTFGASRRAPQTSYNYVVWDWDNGDGTITKYTRSYRVNEGQDYKASFVVIANKKYVLINATLHFVSQEAYAALKNTDKQYEVFVAVGTSIPAQPGVPVAGIATSAQTVTISTPDAEGKANVTFSGFNVAVPQITIENLTIPVNVREENGTIVYTTDEPVQVSISMGTMTVYYNATLHGEQANADSTPTFVLTLSQATIITAVFNATEELAKESATLEYSKATAVESVKTTNKVVDVYNTNGINIGSSAIKGINIIRLSDGTTRKVIK